MPDVRPFCGLRYNLQLVRDASSVITPPYDVITNEERLSYYRRGPHNIIRVESGEDRPGDSPDNNRYTRAAATLEAWLRESVLIREQDPAFYIVRYDFAHQGVPKSRWELIARVRLEDYKTGRIRPHEQITREPAADRLNLLRACRANISPIMGLLGTRRGEFAELLRSLGSRARCATAADNQGARCEMWVVTDRKPVDEIVRSTAENTIYIADGHHRYETALRYQKEQQSSQPDRTGEEPFNFVMMSLMDSCDEGLVMLPTHRLVHGLDAGKVAELEGALSPYFRIEGLLPRKPSLPACAESWLRSLENGRGKGVVLGLYGLHKEKLAVLKLREDARLGDLLAADELALWGTSDVVLLQRVVLQEALGVDATEKMATHLDYTRDVSEAIKRVDAGEFQLAFFVNATPVSGILETANAGKRLPRKSTYFHPKTPAGMVINPVWDG
jgi:uncharacterized protein (DUF1015 family)